MRPVPFLCAAVLACGCQGRWDGILTSLSDPDPHQRAEAVRRVGRSGTPEDLASLILRVNDPAPEVRAAIAEMLGSLDDRQSSDALAALVTDDSESVQLQAVAALARHRDPRAHHYLLLAYQRDGPLVRARIAELLTAGGASPAEAVSAEADALYARYSQELAGSGPERLLAAERLGSSGRPEAIERLTSYLGAESRSLATAAAWGLGASGSPEARGPLEALLNEEDPGLRLAGAEALGELGDPNAAEALWRAVQQDDSASPAALRSLIRLARVGADSQPTTSLLCETLLLPDPQLTVRAAEALADLKRRCPLDRLISRLARGGSVEATLAAVAVLLGSGDPPRLGDERERARLSSAIGTLLRGGSAEVRPLAARAIGMLGLSGFEADIGHSATEAGLEVWRARKHWIRAPPGDTDGGWFDRRLPSLFSPDPPDAVALWAEASGAMIRMGVEAAKKNDPGFTLVDSALPHIAATLATDPSPRPRRVAAETVARLQTNVEWQVLGPLLDDPSPEVRQAALGALSTVDPHLQAAANWAIAQLSQATVESEIEQLMAALLHFRGLPGLDQALVGALERPDTATAAATALGTIGDADARSGILSHLKQPYALALPELLAAAAVQPWDQADSGAAAEACRALLFHTRPEVRAAAVRALLAIAGPAAASEVRALATDYDVRVRRAVASSSGAPAGVGRRPSRP